MISTGFQVILVISMISNLAITIYLIRKGNMRVKYSLLWIFVSVFALLLAVFPQIFLAISRMLFIYNDANALFMIAIGGLYIISFSYSIIFSKNSYAISTLTQEIAILKSKINDLEQEKSKYN